MKDFLGQEISIGDIVVYPTRRRSVLIMNRAKVLSFLEKGCLHIQRDDGKIKTISRVDRVTVVTKQIRG